MTQKKKYISIGKMTHVPKEMKNREHGWFYMRPGIGRKMEDQEPFSTYHRPIPEYYGYHLFDLVHVIMLTEEGIIPKNIGIQLLKVLKEMEKEGIDEARKKAGGVDHSGEAYLIQKLGWDIGGYEHAGRSSGDLRVSHRKIMQRHALLDVADAVNDLRATLLTIAEDHIETILPSYTSLQHARPITLGFFLQSFVNALERNFEVLELIYTHVNTSPMGSVIGSGSDFPVNPQRTAELAGFDSIFTNAMDIYTFDARSEIFPLLGTITTVTATIGATLQNWCSYEFRMAEMADRYCGSSSIMSNKKNPTGNALVNAAVDVRSLMLTANYRFFEEAVNSTINSLRYAKGVLETMTWYPERMRELCEYGFVCNADLCRLLVQKKGLPWRTAHQIAATLTRRALEQGKQMVDVTPALLDECAKEYVGYGKPLNLTLEQLKEAFNVENSVKSLKSHGGTAPERVKEQITTSQERLQQDRVSVMEKRNRLQAATIKREKVINEFLENESSRRGSLRPLS